MTSYTSVQRPAAPPAPTRWQRVRGSTLLRIAVAAGGVPIVVHGDPRIVVSLVVGAVVMYWYGVDTARLERWPALELIPRQVLRLAPLALALVGAALPFVVDGPVGLAGRMILPTAVGLAGMRAGYRLADGGWRWGEFALDWARGPDGVGRGGRDRDVRVGVGRRGGRDRRGDCGVGAVGRAAG